ncbi:CMGC/CDK protein kinase [Microbotryum lychnidis-dioicae p1A1 Lamole]|uniref:[RNA-polymerase]-subunit kinase n=1 Tax=Microbotryum lychnidis-dioicae (strain p1A1 Lamole / MvSl-1064) TaxID=683840 RepID=U5HEN5_USTV1|nr:CMGC/CDK protein kinase [Microbotryum lychnidis-dioicae p1A1 Lamole]|eukprot:KDE03944.1 CMGC/CDK protein kinase [Microbotryum lychnidis-dioicae p1A1 Lamole]
MSGVGSSMGRTSRSSSPSSPSAASANASLTIRGAAALKSSMSSSASSVPISAVPATNETLTTGSAPTKQDGAGGKAAIAPIRLVGGVKPRSSIQFTFKGQKDLAAAKASAYGTRNTSTINTMADKPAHQAGIIGPSTPSPSPEAGKLPFAGSTSPRKKMANSPGKAAAALRDPLIDPEDAKARQQLYEESVGGGQSRSLNQPEKGDSHTPASTSTIMASREARRPRDFRHTSGERPMTPEPFDDSGREEGELDDDPDPRRSRSPRVRVAPSRHSEESLSVNSSSWGSRINRSAKEENYRHAKDDRERSDTRLPTRDAATGRGGAAPRHPQKDSSRRRSHGEIYPQYHEPSEGGDGWSRPSRSPRVRDGDRRRSRSRDDDRRKRPRDDDRDEHAPSSKRMSNGEWRTLGHMVGRDGACGRRDDRDDHFRSKSRRQPSRSPRSPSRSRSRSPQPRISLARNTALGPTHSTNNAHPQRYAATQVRLPHSPIGGAQSRFSELPAHTKGHYNETFSLLAVEQQADRSDACSVVVASPISRPRPGSPLRPSDLDSPGLEAGSEQAAPRITKNESTPAPTSPPPLDPSSSTDHFEADREPVLRGGRRTHVRDTELWVRDETRVGLNGGEAHDEDAQDAGIDLVGSSSIDAYRLQRKLGEGTFGVVSLGTRGKGDISDGEQRREEVLVARGLKVRHGDCVALKKIILHNESDGMPITSLREIRILKALNHSAVVPVVDMAYENGDPAHYKLGSTCMVFPYMDHDLAGLLENPKVKLEVSHIKQYAKQLLEGTDYLHENGLLHRDMKAANLLISNKGHLMIADFGLARSLRKEVNTKGYTNCVVTRWYRPPELLLGQTQYHTAVDMWGVGCVLAEMFHKRPIFPGDSDTNQIVLIAKWCGAPSERSMPGFNELPGCEGVKEFSGPPNNDEIRNRAIKWEAGETFGDLLAHILLLDPDRRLTAHQALDHDWFWTEPYPAERWAIPQWESSHEMDKRQRDEQQQQQQKQDRRHRAPGPVLAPRQNGGPVQTGSARGAQTLRPNPPQPPIRHHQPMQAAPYYGAYPSGGPSWIQSAHSNQQRSNGSAPAPATKTRMSMTDMMKR